MRDWAHSRRLGTPADEAGSVVLRQPQSSKLASATETRTPRTTQPPHPSDGSYPREIAERISVYCRFAVWWVVPPWPILPVPAVLLALCRLVELKSCLRCLLSLLDQASLSRM